MEPSYIILTFTAIVVLILMVYLFRQNRKDRKAYEKDLNTLQHTYQEESEVNDIE
jgi:preprotein translocase subunit YajC